jgi:hypothetical protein
MARRRGRPALDPTVRLVPLTVRLTPAAYDALAQRALRDRVSLPTLVRCSLEHVADRMRRGPSHE